MRKTVKAKVIVGGYAEGELIVISTPISLLGEFDPKEGMILTDTGKQWAANKILAIPSIRGSTVGSYVLYAAKENGVAPRGIIVLRPDPIIITGAVISDIPLYQPIESIEIEELRKYSRAVLDPVQEIIVLNK